MPQDDGNFDRVRIAVTVCALSSLVLICGYFVLRAFGIGPAAGLRSTAGILLPFVIGGFLAAFNRTLFEKIATVPATFAFAVSLVFGIGVMLLIENISVFEHVPIAELVVAAGLSLFLYTPGAVMTGESGVGQREVWIAYYFGVVSGMLGYIVFVGFPGSG